ncbi:MAG: ABC transporter permease [Clostridiales bacterium]|nr:ABC transporter permease [Clostridiales bacterium]
MLLLAIKKIINNKILMLSLFAGILCAVIISCTIPMYSQAISHRMLITQLENYQDSTAVSPSSVIVSCPLSSFTRRDEESTNFDNFNFYNDYLNNNIFPGLYMPPLVKSTTLSCATMLAKDNRDKKLSNLNKVVLKATDTYENAVNIISGRMPSNNIDEKGCIEVIISRAVHISHKYVVGTTLDLAYNKEIFDVNSKESPLLSIKIVGIFDYIEDSYSPFIDKDAGIELYCDYNTYFDYIFKQKDLCSNVTWYYAGDFTQFNINNIDKTISTIKSLENNIKIWSLSGNTKTIIPPIEQYVTYYDNVQAVNILLILFYSPVFLLIIYFIFMISGFVVEKDKNEISMLTSRGASRKQILFLYFLQGGAILLISLIVAPLLSITLCNFLGASSGFLEFGQRAPIKVSLNISSIIFCLIASIISLLTMLIPVYNVSKIEIVEQKRKTSNKALSFIFLTIGAIISAVIAGYSYYNLVYQKEGVFTSNGGIQPLAYVFLICIFVFIALLLVIIYPLLIKFFFNLGKRKWNPAKYTAFSRMKNLATKERFIIIFLTLTVAIGSFASVCSRTLNYNIDNSLNYLYPCDIMADVKFYSVQENNNINRRFIYNDVEGIEATRVVTGNLPRISSRRGQSINDNVKMLAINPQEFNDIVQWDDSLFNECLNDLASDANCCIISRNVAQALQLNENDFINLKPDSSLKSRYVETYRIKKIVDTFPTYIAETKNLSGIKQDNYLIVVNVKSIDSIAPNQPYSVWMNTDKSINELKSLTIKLGINTENYEDKANIRLENIVNCSTEKHMGKINPLRQATNGSLTLGFICVIFICAIGFIIYWIISIKSRTLQIGTMRALGMSFSEISKMVLWEQILICIAPVILGILSGVCSGYLFAPLLQSAFDSMNQMPSYIFDFNYLDIIKLILFIIILVSVSIIAGIIMLKRIKSTTAIKLGEE